jgi:uncharacterized membrane protein
MGAMSNATTIVAATGAGLTAGVFFAFSTFIMKALARLPDAQAISAMQAINKAAPNPWFMTALFGTAAVCVALAISGITRVDEPAARYQLIGSVLYLVGIVVTVGYHIPRNNALDRVDPDAAGAPGDWARYASPWTAWNHVRTLASLAAAVVLTVGQRAG